ncbi:hypothetical protein [Enterobacter hormaechei]|uniref:hypothetical protein n=1 Tax=Enterobacter hormaechei TaxID=158836 RepID=UPI003CF39298
MTLPCPSLSTQLPFRVTMRRGQIVRAIELANARQECDVLIVGRGGGSLGETCGALTTSAWRGQSLPALSLW